MGLAEQILYTFIATFFAGYLFKNSQIKEQLVDPAKYRKMVEELGVVQTEKTITKIEIVVGFLIVLLIVFATLYTSDVTLNDWVVQIILTALAGFAAGYFYRTYKLKQQLLHPDQYEGLLRDFGLIPSNRKATKIELFVELMIVLLIIYAIYLSMGSPI